MTSTLTEIGLDAAQAVVYETLVADPSCAPADLVRRSAQDVETVTAALRDLTLTGLALPDPGCPAGVRLLPPGRALADLLTSTQERLAERQRRITAAGEEIAELEGRYRRAQVPAVPVPAAAAGAGAVAGLELLSTPAQVRARLDELSFFARTSVYSVQPGGLRTTDEQSHGAAQPAERRSRRRRLETRLLLPSAAATDADGLDRLLRACGETAQVRWSELPLQRMVVLDEQVVVVPERVAGSGGALVVRHPGLVSGLVALFNRWWDQAQQPTADAAETAVPDDGLSDRDRQVLALLAEGCTDEVAAARTGLSVRHLRRTVAALMTRLGASSRFEAGALAARRGWI